MAGLHVYWQAYHELSTCRPVGMGVGPIPWTAISEYALRNGVFDPDDFDELVHHVRALDTTFLEHHERKNDTGRH